MGNKASTEKSQSAEDVINLFEAAGKHRTLKSGEVFIKQGAPSPMMYLINTGEVVLIKQYTSGGEKEVVRRGPGEILGELSFLLHTPAAVRAEAVDTVDVIELNQSRVLEFLKEDPTLAAHVFRFLANALAERIAQLSASLKSSVDHTQAAQEAPELHATKLTQSPAEIAAAFNIDPSLPLLLHCKCSVIAEKNSVRDAQESAGALYVFSTHLCVEATAFGLTRQHVVHLRDVLGLLRQEKGSPDTVEVQCRALSLTLTMPKELFDPICQGVEQARMNLLTEEQTRGATGDPSAGPATPRSGAVVVDENVAELMSTKAASDNSASELPATLTAEHWASLIRGAERRRYKQGDIVLREGESARALYQIARGTLRVEVAVKNRPQALVLARRGAGEIFGERTLLLGGVASASMVVDTEEAVVLTLSLSSLEKLFTSEPELPGKFYCFMATSQGRRLYTLTSQEDAPELALPKGSTAPTDMATLAGNRAFLTIFYKYVKSLRDAGQLAFQLEFYMEVGQYAAESNAAALPQIASDIFYRYLRETRSGPSLDCVSTKKRQQIEQELREAKAMAATKLRHIFDVVAKVCLKNVELECLAGFLQSPHYHYVIALKCKENVVPAIEHFKALRVLGQGGFGQVIEVVKRDCGKRYAMKVMKKQELQQAFSHEWKEVVLLERVLHADMHHPLVVNLAYAFQNAKFLVLVMDSCPGGDLSAFALTKERLTPSQVRFVGLEVVAALSFLHERYVLYRDLKPENLLLDEAGHVRLIDFGLAIRGEGKLPSSTEVCGTPCYMAPEVKFATRLKKPYSGPADWYTLGVLIYELSEQNLPFGDDPQFDSKTVYRRPELLDDRGKKDKTLHDLVHRLLEPSPAKRLGSVDGPIQVKEHAYWQEPEWELLDQRRMPSPLRPLVAQRMRAPREEKLRKQQRAALETASAMAAADSLPAVKEDPKKGRAKGKKGDGGGLPAVEGWGYVSPEAITQEYTETAASCVSIV